MTNLEAVLDAAAELTGRRDGTWLYGLEPDLLGETLILSRCNKSNANAGRRIKTLLELAWRAARPGQDGSLLTGEILYLMARDFPGQIVDSGLLAPPRSTEPAVVSTRAATLAGIIKAFERHVSLDKALSFYSMLRDEADVEGTPNAIREWRAIAASSLTLSLLFRDLERHLMLDSLIDKDISSLGRGGVTQFYPDENRIAALEFFNQELRNAAELANAPHGVLEERSLTAASLMNEIIDDDLEQQVRFYRSEIADPLGRPNATVRMRKARANVAAILFQKINFARGLDAALAFYDTELRQPAEEASAPEEVREERAIVAAGLDKGSANWLGISLGIARAKARFSLIGAIVAEQGLDDAIGFCRTDLSIPAQNPLATDILKEARAAGAVVLLDEFVMAGRFDEAMGFYEEESRSPALAADAPADCRTWRAIAAFNLSNKYIIAEGYVDEMLDFYDSELRRPTLQPDAPEALAEWRAKAAFNILTCLVNTDDVEELKDALIFCVTELARPAAVKDGYGSTDARLALERAVRLFEMKADAAERGSFPQISQLSRRAAERFHSILRPTSSPALK